MFNKRKHVRVCPRADRPVLVHVVADNFLEHAWAQDISVGGLGVRCARRFEGCDVNHQVELIVVLPGERPFKAMGLVKNIAVKGQDFFGLEFQNLSAEVRERIERYVDRRVADGLDVLAP